MPSGAGRPEEPLEDLQSPETSGHGEWSGFDGAGPVVNHTCHCSVNTRAVELHMPAASDY